MGNNSVVMQKIINEHDKSPVYIIHTKLFIEKIFFYQ